jgi:hypothetical protein
MNSLVSLEILPLFLAGGQRDGKTSARSDETSLCVPEGRARVGRPRFPYKIFASTIFVGKAHLKTKARPGHAEAAWSKRAIKPSAGSSGAD